MPAAPDVKKRVALRKIESELKNYNPPVYKNDMLLPNFAEGLRVLYLSTKPIMNLLSETVCSENLDRNHHFIEQLMMTGFSDNAQEIIESLSYENRKEAARNTSDNLTRHFEVEHIKLEKVFSELKGENFSKIDKVLDGIKQLDDVCCLNYVSMLKLFDQRFSVAEGYSPAFQAIPLDLAENMLQDIYYVVSGLDISASTSNAIRALYQLYNRDRINQNEEVELGNCLRKIQGVIKNLMTDDLLIKLIHLAAGEPEKVPEKAKYNSDERTRYAKYLENRFVIDEGRLKNELQNETIGNEVKILFGDRQLETLTGYNSKINDLLKQSSPCSFFWILPMEVLKTFLMMFYDERVKPFLNDVVIEGFFNLNDYKSDFAARVYSVNDSLAHIELFEKKFAHLGPFDENLIQGFIRDSHKDEAFVSKLKILVDEIDKEAKALVQAEASNIAALASMVKELVVEAKKPSSEVVTNIKVLAMSSRNRDNFGFLDMTISQWDVFLEIMKSYVVVTGSDKKK